MAFSSPAECFDRLATLAQSRLEAGRFTPPRYNAQPFTSNLERLSAALKADLERFLTEPAAREVESQVADCLAHSSSRGNFDSAHNADPALARLCYVLCRALKPTHVLETGVAHGITTAFLLKALEVNGTGHLWSIDLPPLASNADDSVGRAVPKELRSRWTLCRGKSRRILPALLRHLAPIDIFIHDSLHTYRNETFEFATAWPQLRNHGVLVSDDIEAHPAWVDWERKVRPLLSLVFEERPKAQESLRGMVTPKFGVMIKNSNQQHTYRQNPV